MKQIDLDDLPPRVAAILAAVAQGESLALVQGGALVATLHVASTTPAASTLAGLPPEAPMAEVMEQFNAMIHDEF
jgi:antitoxin (DNA-binding transcriptional repressor) of toxin-antitoxin stability system